MIKAICLLLVSIMCLSTALQAQERYFTKNGYISFFSKAPLEDIEAHNKQVVSFIDFKNGEIVFSVSMEAFKFRKSLMQRHFNENYVESDKYPKSTFKGHVTNIQTVDLSRNNTYKVNIEGDLTIHGVTRFIRTTGTLMVKGKRVRGQSTFSVSPQDYDIKIPFIVRDNIAKRIDITVDILYTPYVKNSL